MTHMDMWLVACSAGALTTAGMAIGGGHLWGWLLLVVAAATNGWFAAH